MKFVIILTAAMASLAGGQTRLPMVFEPNVGQAPAPADFVARTPQGSILLSADGATLLPSKVRMKVLGARGTKAAALERLPGISSYFKGSDSSQWRTGIPHYGKVRYANVYRGIDLVYYGAEAKLEYDFIVSPGASPDNIEIAFDGADRVRTDASGDLLIEADGRTIRQLRPHVYQWTSSGKQEIAGGYRIRRDGTVQFALARYDTRKPLVIDPVIQYATYIGRGGHDTGVAVAVDGAGNAFIAGETTSNGFATENVAQGVRAGDQDAFVAKVSPNGTVLFITYLGGNRTDTGLGIAVDSSGNPYICGVTLSADFPVRFPAQANMASAAFDSFVAKLNSTGTQLTYATYLGGSAAEWASAIAIDAENAAWVTGWTASHDFPVRAGLYTGTSGGNQDVFVTRIAPSGQSLAYSTYFGGERSEYSTGIAVEGTTIYVSGATTSTVFPLVNALQQKSGGGQDGFVFKLDTDKNNLFYSTFLGGADEDMATRVVADGAGNAYVVGNTKSANFPTAAGAYRTSATGGADLFAAKIAPAGALAYSTLAGGTGDDWAGGAAVDAAGTLYVSGWTNSQNFPTVNPIQSGYQGGELSTQRYDALVLRLSPAGDQLLYATYLGGRGEDKAYGIALDSSSNLLVAGATTSPNFPSATGEYQSGLSANDVFLARLSADAAVSLLLLTPNSLSLTARTSDANLPVQSVAVSSTAGPLTFVASSSASWLRVSQSSGTTPANLTLSIDAAGLPAGTHTAQVGVQGQSRATLTVTLTVVSAPSISSVTPSPVARSNAEASINITGGGFAQSSFVEANGTRVATTFVDVRNLRAVVPASLLRDPGRVSLVVVNPDARSNTYDLEVSSAVALSPGSIVHAATRTSGPIAPGELLLINAGGVAGTPNDFRLLFDGIAAPVTGVGSGLVSAIAPYALAGRESVQAVLEFRGQPSAPLTLPVAAAVPGVFTVDGSGIGQASAYHENGSANSSSNRVQRGSILVLYGTGEGAVSPAVADAAVVQADNLPRPVLPVSVRIGGVEAEVLYAGSVPGVPAGLLQLNVRVPAGAISGAAVPVTLSVGAFTSPATATVAIE